jgi:hypothetical protein
MKEALRFSETSVLTRATRRNIPEDTIILSALAHSLLYGFNLGTYHPCPRHFPTKGTMHRAADDITTWTCKWCIKLNEIKSTYINFTNQKIDPQSILLNGVRIPPANTAKYLRMTLHAKLCWKAHIKKKQGELKIKF